MLKIFKQNKRLTLSPNIQIGVVIENPMMVDERLPVPYTLSFEIPDTPENLREFGYPDRFGVHEGKKLFMASESRIDFGPIPIFNGTLSLIEYDKALKLTFKGVDFNESLKKAMFGKDFGEVIFEGSTSLFDWNNPASYYYHYKNWMDGLSYNLHPDYVAAPIHIKTNNSAFKWYYNRTDSRGNEYSRKTSVDREMKAQYLNCFNPTEQSFLFPGSTNYSAPIFPLFRLKYLINKLVGDKLENSPFDATEMRDVLVPTFFFKYWNEIETVLLSSPWREDPGYLKFEDYMPDFPANTFLKTILNLFCMTLTAHKGNFVITHNKDIFSRPVVHNWSSKLIDNAKPSTIEGQTYDYGFSDPEYYKPDENETIETVATVEAMRDKSFNLSGTDDSYNALFFITETEQYFAKSAYYSYYLVNGNQEFELVIDYEFKGYKEPEAKTEIAEQDKFNAKADIKQLYLQPAIYWTGLGDTENKKFWIVPRWDPQTPSDTKKTARQIRPTNLSLLLYAGTKTAGGLTYPFLSPYKNDNISLKWEGSDGLIARYHQDFKTWIEKPRLKVKGFFLLSALDLNSLAITDKVHLNGRNFFIERIEYTIRHDRIDPANVELIEV
ncbi:hypothetical protein [Sphingobacterium sp.]|uniref:hypothetical protein n=1 Tax=Sphingobacterium sp. TaxID=341027 RepID=UPI0028AD32A4|nr:hypothetical protein [Sphingobacterium sp.]